MTIDRCMTILFKKWEIFVTKKNLIIYAISLNVLAFAVNFHLIILNGIETVVNGTTKVDCFATPIFPLWEQVFIYKQFTLFSYLYYSILLRFIFTAIQLYHFYC